MRVHQLLALIERAELSPEKAAADLGVSGMTLRRWRSKPQDAVLPEMYRRAFEPTVKRLIGEGKLHPEDPDAASAFESEAADPFQRTLLGLGITMDILRQGDKNQGTVVMGLARIGEDENRRRQVSRSEKMFARFQKMSADWKERVTTLKTAIASPKLTAVDKLVAFGALFYLITPFDLIPDAIPAFGLVDDFIVLGIAALYYKTRFPHLFPRSKR